MKNRIKYYRIEKNYRPDELAREIGLNDYHELFDIEAGKKDPSLSTVRKLVRVLGIPAGEIFPSLGIKDNVHYERYIDELQEATRVLKHMNFHIVCAYADQEKTIEYYETLTAINTAISCIRKVRKEQWQKE